MSMETDLALYEQLKPDLVRDFLGQFVLIKDEKLVDVYPTYKAAYEAAVAQFGSAEVLIKEVTVEERVETI